DYSLNDGYASINRYWKKGDRIEIDIPVQPRMIMPSDSIKTISGKIALAAGPIVYCFEAVDNRDLNSYRIDPNTRLQISYKPGLLHGVNTISGTAATGKKSALYFTAIPFY